MPVSVEDLLRMQYNDELANQQAFSAEYPVVNESRNIPVNGLDLQNENLNLINNSINSGVRSIQNDPNIAIQNMYRDVMNVVGYQNEPEKNIVNSHPIVSTLLLGLLGGGVGMAMGNDYYNTNADNFLKGFLGGTAGAGSEIAKAKQKWKEESNKQKVELAKAMFSTYANHGYNNAGTIGRYAVAANQMSEVAPKIGTQYGYQDNFYNEGINVPTDSYGNPIQMTKDFYESETTASGAGKMAYLMNELVGKQVQKSQDVFNNNYDNYQQRSDGSKVSTVSASNQNSNYSGNVNLNNRPQMMNGIPTSNVQQAGIEQVRTPMLRGVKPSDITTAYNNYADNVVTSQREGARLGETNRHNVVNEQQGQQKSNSYVNRNSTLNTKTNTEVDKIKNPDKYAATKDVKPEKQPYFNVALSEFYQIKTAGDGVKISKARANFIKRYGIDPEKSINQNKVNTTDEEIKKQILDGLNKK